jgi:hypothetical protein
MYNEDKDESGCEEKNKEEERSWSKSWTVDRSSSGDLTPANKRENSLTTDKEM